MKLQLSIAFTLAFAVGCSDSSKQRVITPANVDFDTAVEIIATSDDFDYVNSAQARLVYGGLPAIAELRLHLSDERIIPTGYSNRSINSGEISIATHAFWTIQDMIETGLPKYYDESYHVLNSGNVERWLDDRSDKSLIELQIDAASSTLAHAQREQQSGDQEARGAVKILTERLKELRASEDS